LPSASDTPPVIDSALQRRILVERVAMLGEGARVSAVGGIVGVLVCAASTLMVAGALRTLVWVAWMVPLILANLWFYREMLVPGLTPDRAAWLEKLHALRSALTGIGWGCLILVLPDRSEINQLALTAVLIMSVAMANVGPMALSRPVFHFFLLPTMAPLTVFMLLRPPDTLQLAGWGTLTYLLFVLFLHRTLHRTLRATLLKRLSSEALAQEQQVIFDAAAEAIVFVRGTHIVKCNLRFAELMGTPVEEVLGSPMWVWHADASDWARHEEAAQKHAGPRPYSYVAPMRRRDGQLFSAALTGVPVDPRDAQAGMVWMGSDISERLATEAALRNSEERFRRLVSMSSDLYWEQDKQLRFTRFSGASLGELGHALEAASGKRLWELPHIEGVAPETWTRHRALVDACESFRDLVFQLADPVSGKRWFAMSGNPIFDDEDHFLGYHGVATDITDRIRSAERYRHLAYHDPLTGLPNRRLLADRLEQAIVQARRRNALVAVMLLDLDDFKIINDSAGHAVGDAVLASIAHRLRTAVRESDTVARVGGDEFVVLLPEVDSREAAGSIAAKIVDAVREPVHTQEHEYVLGVSVGIALFPNDGDTGDRLLQRADSTMYLAKQSGGRHARFAEDHALRPTGPAGQYEAGGGPDEPAFD